jgi:aspartate aminotransferase
MNDLQKTVGFMGNLAQSTTLKMAAKAKEMKAQGIDICSMSAGEPDFDTPKFIKDAAIEALNSGKTTYTDSSGIIELRKAIADKFLKDNQIQTTPAQVIVGPGAKFSVFSAIAALCGPGDEVIIPAPFWLSYPEMVTAAGAKSVFIETKAENNYELLPQDLERAVNSKTRLLILNSPSNPTGAVYRKATLEAIAAIAVKHNFMVLSDEIYEKLVYEKDFPHVSIAALNAQIAELTITVNGFSKAYAMTGWRLGYLTAPMWLSKKISALQSHLTSNPTTFAQYGGLKALECGEPEIERMRQSFATRRDLIYQLAGTIPKVKSILPQGAFYLFCDISACGLGSAEFSEKLLETEKLVVIPGDAFGADKCIRMSYACSEANIRNAISRLGNFCAKF